MVTYPSKNRDIKSYSLVGVFFVALKLKKKKKNYFTHKNSWWHQCNRKISEMDSVVRLVCGQIHRMLFWRKNGSGFLWIKLNNSSTFSFRMCIINNEDNYFVISVSKDCIPWTDRHGSGQLCVAVKIKEWYTFKSCLSNVCVIKRYFCHKSIKNSSNMAGGLKRCSDVFVKKKTFFGAVPCCF